MRLVAVAAFIDGELQEENTGSDEQRASGSSNAADQLARLRARASFALDGRTVRALPLARVEAYFGAGPRRDAVLAAWGKAKTRAGKPADSLTALRDLRTRAVMAATTASDRRSAARSALARPGRTPTDDFYARVAEEYLLRVGDTHAPATLLAQEADVPVGTVHRWIREARRRGHLPPGRPGRAG